ncbi:MAG: acyl-ACP thioesterase domain-containing protein [Myxococcota bacterium]|nr:acyl-ACP thioesterase domain-containing protein [Myxococcota bacterium]
MTPNVAPFSLTKNSQEAGEPLTPLFFLQTFQELASLHATELGVSRSLLSKDKLAWMLHRLKVQFYKRPNPDRDIYFETYPSGFLRMLATRDYIARDHQGEIVVRATSSWLIANTEKRRAIPIPEWVQRRAPAYATPQLDLSTRRIIERQKQMPTIAGLTVQETDIDFLEHVNNTRYAHWILKYISEEFLKKHVLQELDILFKSEAHLHDQLQIELQQDATVFSHRIRSAKSQAELIQAQTKWGPKS